MEAQERILIVDDDVDMTKSLSSILKKVGYDTETANTGNEAIDKISHELFNLALLDINLPDAQGTELLTPIKEINPEIDIIMITAETSIDSAIKALTEGASGYILKPLKMEDLLTKVKNSLEKQRLKVEKRETQYELSIRNEVSNIFLTFPGEDMYGEVLSVILRLFQSKYGVFGFINENEDYICPSMTRDVWDRCQMDDKVITFPRESWHGIWGDALVKRKSQYSNEPFNVPEGHIPIFNALDVPIIYNNKSIGNILIGNKTDGYNQKDIKLLESIADFISPILQARLERDREEEQRKKAEQELRDSKNKFQALFNNANDAIFIHDMGSEFLEVNKTACERLGYAKEELLKIAPKDIVPPGLNVDIQRNIKILNEKGMITIDSEHMTKDGHIIPVEISSRIFNYGGKNAIISVARDIKDRKNAEKELKKREHDLGERVKEITCLYNILKITVQPNISVEEIIDKTLNFIPPAWQYPNITCAKIVFKGKEFISENFKTTKWNQKAIIKEHGNKIGTVEIYYLKEMPEIDEGPFLQEERSLIDAIADILSRFIEQKNTALVISALAKFPSENPNPVLRVTKDRVIYANNVGENLFDVKLDSLVPKSLNDYISDAFSKNEVKEIELLLDSNIYSFVITPIKEAGYANIYGRNITEQKNAEQAIQRRNTEFSALLKASRSILENNKFDQSSKEIFNACAKLLGATLGYVALISLSKRENKVVFVNTGELKCGVDPNLTLTIGLQGLTKEVVRARRAIYNNDFSNSKWMKFIPEGHMPINNIMLVPLLIENEVVGILGLANKQAEFTEKDATLAMAFTDLATIALINSNFLESLEKSEQKYRNLSNILEQKVDERTFELKKSEEKIRNIINNITDALMEAEQDGTIIFLSPQIFNIAGYQPDELIGTTFADILHPDDIHSYKFAIKDKIESKNTVSIECRIQHKKGYYVPVTARGTLVEIEGELKVIGVISDNTERKKIDDMIKSEIKKLKNLDEMRSDLVRRISHELNTPLISIFSGAQYLLNYCDDKLSDNIQDIVKIIHKGGNRLREMVDNLIIAYDIESEGMILDLKRENIIPIIENSIENVILEAKKRKIFINLELLDELYLDIDKSSFSRTFINILSNAVKNTPANGNVFVKTFEHPDYTDIIIKDTGVGLTKKEIPLLFKKFGKIERYGKGLDVDIEGPGLGLYIAKEIIKLHKGDILVKSKGRNEGSTFIIRINTTN